MMMLGTTLLFGGAFLLAIWTIAATLAPEWARIVRLLRHGPMTEAVEMPMLRIARSRRVSMRRPAATFPPGVRAAA